MEQQTTAPVRLLSDAGALDATAIRASRVEHMLRGSMQRILPPDERAAAIAGVVLDVMGDCSVEQVQAVIDKIHAAVQMGYRAERVVSFALEGVTHD